MGALDQKKKAKGLDDRDPKGGQDGYSEDNQKIDPKELRKQMQIMNAERRRDEWIRHQTDVLSEFKDRDDVFRKGVDRGANPVHHDFRA